MRSSRLASILGILALAIGAATCVNPNERLVARAKRLALVTEPAGAIVGAPFAVQPVVELHDDADNKVTLSNVAVTAVLAEGSGTLVGSSTVIAVDGIATFSDLAVDAPGPHALAFTAVDLSPASSAPFAVGLPPAEAPVPTVLAIVTQPSASVVSGLTLPTQPVIRVLDQGGNPIAASGMTITASIASGGGTITGSATATTDAEGIATYSGLGISGTVGSRTLSFDATSVAGVTSNPISIIAGIPAALSFTVQPSASAQSGVPLAQQPVVQLRDSSGNVVNMAGIVVTASIASGGGTLSGSTTATTTSSGQASFTNLTVSGTPGTRTLSLDATGMTGLVSDPIALAVGPAAKVLIVTQPSSTAQSGVSFGQQPVLQLADAGDNFVAQAGITITAAIASGGGTLGGAPSVVTGSTGSAAFTNLSVAGTVGNRTLRFNASGLQSATSTPIAVTAGAAAQLALTVQPAGAVSGTAFTTQPVVEIRDASNNLVTSSTVPVTVAIASGTGTLNGTATVSAVNGQARFTGLALDGTGSFTLTFTSSGLGSVTSNSFSVSPGIGTPTKLAVTTSPSSSASGTPFATQPIVQVRDANNALAPTSNAAVTAAVATGTGTLSGTLTVNAVNGVATFTDLRITGTGLHTLRFTSPPLTSTTSSSFSITSTPTQIAVNDGNNQSASKGQLVGTPPSVIVKDQFGNPVSGIPVLFAVTSGGGSITGANQTTGSNGVARVGSWTLGSTQGTNTLSATSAGLNGSPVTFTATATAFTPSLFYNSSEPGCGSDPSIVLCDDFESGSWYTKNCDQANASGGLQQTKGWCGTIFADPTTPTGAAICGGAGAAGTNCAAHGGEHKGAIGGVNMADHNLGPNNNGYNEIWLRYYIKPLAGYQYGAQKMITINSTSAGSGGISIGGAGSPFGNGAYDACPVYDCNTTGEVYYYRQNQASKLTLSQIIGHWAYVEMHIKMNTPGQANGIWELWLNDCGTDGRCTGTPTLRSRYTTVKWQGPNDNKQIRSIWFENWANPASVGTELYDQIMVKTTGPIGFAP